MKDLDKFMGCLIGGAAGDALGYPVEFWQEQEIFSSYGKKGITGDELSDDLAKISDDTQMTLYTANGLILGATKTTLEPGQAENYLYYIAQCYFDWLRSQASKNGNTLKAEYSWLNNIQAMCSSRAPGNTCLAALMDGKLGSVVQPVNDSKGCGGIMRVAPIGLFFDESEYPIEAIDILGAEAAALTHGHELGYIPAALFVHIIQRISHEPGMALLSAIQDAVATVSDIFGRSKYLPEMLALIDKAIDLSRTDRDELEAIRQLGEGWVAEETLAIAIYCSLKHTGDFDKAVIAAVNHGGDSDSTGSVTGNILGAYHGLKGIPEKYLHNLELRDVIMEMARDLYQAAEKGLAANMLDQKWLRKYRV